MECLHFSYEQTTFNGNIHMTRTNIYNPKLVITGPGKAEMTMQWQRLPGNDYDPEGGYYVFLADIEKTENERTRLTMHGSSFFTWNPIYNAVYVWGQGKTIECPKTP